MAFLSPAHSSYYSTLPPAPLWANVAAAQVLLLIESTGGICYLNQLWCLCLFQVSVFWPSGEFLNPFGSPWREAELLTLYILFPIIFSSYYFSTPNAIFFLSVVLQEYIDAHPETIILDPLPAIRTLLDRSKSYELIRQIEAYMQGRPISLLPGGFYCD